MGDSPLSDIDDKNFNEIFEGIAKESDDHNEDKEEAKISDKENELGENDNEKYSDDQNNNVNSDEEKEEDHPITQFFQKFKKKSMRSKNNIPTVALEERIQGLIRKLNEAYENDLKSLQEKKPAMEKLKIISQAEAELKNVIWK